MPRPRFKPTPRELREFGARSIAEFCGKVEPLLAELDSLGNMHPLRMSPGAVRVVARFEPVIVEMERLGQLHQLRLRPEDLRAVAVKGRNLLEPFKPAEEVHHA